MKYCQQCGAQLPDQAKFCRSCGAQIPPRVNARTSDDGEGIVIDAPDEATVSISEEPEEVEQEKGSGESSGFFSHLLTYAKILIFVVCIVFAAVFVKGFFKGDTPEASKQEQMEEYFQQPVQSTTNVEDVQNVQEVQEVSGDETTQEFVTNDPTNNNTGEDEVIFEADDDPHSGFGIIDDMPLPERAEYLQNLLANSERYLREELAKGDDADQGIISQLRRHIAKLRERLSQFKQ